MYNKDLREQLNKYEVNDIITLSDAIRELAQKILLSALSKYGAFEKIVFYGGTSLRIVHHIDRFSEDLDFTLRKEGSKVSMKEFEEPIIKEFSLYGINAHITSKPSYDEGEILRRYVKFPLLDIINDYYLNRNFVCNKEQLVTIKFEIDNAYNEGANYEEVLLDFPSMAKISLYDYPSLFGGKLCAVINRNWKSRVKGRDFYDYLFYVKNNVPINLNYMKNKMGLNEFTLEDLKSALHNRFTTFDIDSAKKDVSSFVFDKSLLDNWSVDLFLSTIDNLKSI